MQKIYLLFLLLFCSLVVYAQETKTEIKLETGVKLENETPEIEISESLNFEMPKLKWDEQVKNDPLKPLKFEGFSKMYNHSVDEKIYYRLYGNLTIFPGLSTSQTAGGSIGIKINQSFLVNFGAYGLKYDYNFGNQPYYDAVMHLDASYKILPWLIVGAHAQYSAFSKYNVENGSILPSPFVPYSNYGVHATTMFTETFGIQGTVGKEYDPFNKRWQPVYGISPVINLNKLFK